MRALLAGVAAAGLVAAGATTAAAGTVSRPYTVTVQRGHVKTTYRCVRSPVRSTWRRADCIPQIRPRVTLDAQVRPAIDNGGGIVQSGTEWAWRISQAPPAGILEIDNVYTEMGYTMLTHSADQLIEIQLTNHGGAYQGDCVTWNASLQEFDAIGCAWKVSQEFNIAAGGGGEANLQSWYTKNCAQANDDEGEGSAVGLAVCGSRNNTVWVWSEIGD